MQPCPCCHCSGIFFPPPPGLFHVVLQLNPPGCILTCFHRLFPPFCTPFRLLAILISLFKIFLWKYSAYIHGFKPMQRYKYSIFFFFLTDQSLKNLKSLSLQNCNLHLPTHTFLPLLIPWTWNLYPSRFPNFRVNFNLSKPLWILSTNLSPAVFHLISLQTLQFKLITSFELLRFSLKLGRHCSLHSPDPCSVIFRVTFILYLLMLFFNSSA